MIRVAITDDHPLVLDGLKTLLNNAPGIFVAAECKNGAETINALHSKQVDVLLLDIQLPDINGIDLCERLMAAFPALKIICITMHDDALRAKTILQKGAKGYILKNTPSNLVIHAIEEVWAGNTYIVDEIQDKLNHKTSQYEQKVSLTRKEQEIVKLVLAGLTSQDIADKLCLSKLTVDTHRKHIMNKTGCKNIADLVSFTLKTNLE